MKVRALRLTAVDGMERSKSEWLTIGREYVVLAIQAVVAPPVPSVNIVILTDAGRPHVGLFDLADFEITDGRLSSYWRSSFEDSLLQLQHEQWTIPGFWEAFHDEDPTTAVPDAHDRFDAGVRELLGEAGATVTLYRPTGPKELALVEESGWLAWPPRLPEQPIF